MKDNWPFKIIRSRLYDTSSSQTSKMRSLFFELVSVTALRGVHV